MWYRNTTMRGTAILALALIVLATGAVRAQPQPAASPRQRAARLHRESADLYRAGRYREAAEVLRVAYALHPEPVINYNLGRTLEALGDAPGAVEAYERYLATAGAVPDRAAVEARVQVLRARLATSTQPASAPLGDREPPRRGLARRVAPYAVTGVGAATLAVGTVFAGWAWHRYNDSTKDPGQVTASATHATARDWALRANVLLAAGGAVALGGAIWLLVERPWREAPRRSIEVSFGPGGMSVGGRF